MNPKPNQTLLIFAGVVLAVLLSFGVTKTDKPTTDNTSADLLSQYKSSVPLIIAPLHVLVKGLRLAKD